MSERDVFEQWAIDQFYSAEELAIVDPGNARSSYIADEMEMLWLAFQEGYAAVKP